MSTYSSLGLLYVRINKARSLIRNTKAYVSLRIENGSDPIKLRTDVTDNGWNFYDEFLMTVAYRPFPLLLAVWAKLVLPNIAMGDYEYDLTDIPDNTLITGWVALQNVPQGELNISVYFIPQVELPSPENYIFQKFNRLRYTLERKEYFPGEVVRGFIIFTANYERRRGKISMICSGNQRINLPVRQGNKQSEDEINRIIKFHEVFFDPEDDSVLPAGFYYYPFEFSIPISAPPSFTYGNAETKYRLVFMVEDSNLLVSDYLEILTGFTVREPSPLIIDESPYSKNVIISNSETRLDVTLELFSNVVMLGDSFNLSVKIGNQTKAPVTCIQVQLVQKKIIGKTSNKNVIYEHELEDVQDGQLATYTTDIEAIDDLPFSMPRGSIVEVTYKIIVRCEIQGFTSHKGRTTVSLPIVFADKIPEELKNITPPDEEDPEIDPNTVNLIMYEPTDLPEEVFNIFTTE